MNPWSTGVPARSHGHSQTGQEGRRSGWMGCGMSVDTRTQKPSLTSSQGGRPNGVLFYINGNRYNYY